MVGLGILLGLMVLAIPVALIYLMISHSGAKRELRELRAQILALQARVENAPLPTPEDDRVRAKAGEQASAGPADVKPSTTPEPRPGDVAAPKAAAQASPDPDGSPEPAAPAKPAAAQASVSATSTSAAPTDGAVSGPPRAVVLGQGNLRRLALWLGANWFYAVSALSLALAGLFLVQYGVENGLLPPPVRVLAALAFGALLIVAGEVIRRRYGDDAEATTAHLPSVFSGAGIVALFGGILSARLLYDLVGAETALAGMVAVALVALVLGWFHGPLLAAVGILGAFGAPFMVGGSSDDPSWLYGYFAIITALGLGIDTVRRWAWITVLTLALAYPAGGLVVLGDTATTGAFALYLTGLLAMAVAIPVRRLLPIHGGTMIVETLARTPQMPWPDFPVRVAFAACAVSVAGLVWVSDAGAAEFWLATGLLTAGAAVLILASGRAPALQDVALVPALGLLAALTWHGDDRQDVWRGFHAAYADNPEADPPLAVTVLLVMAGLISALALWRSLALRGATARFAVVWAGAAALLAPLAAILLELTWNPAAVIGAYPWALHAAAIAAAMVVFSERLARVDGPEDRLRMSLPVLSALSALAFSFTILFAETALTLAFVATTVSAAALDRALRLPAMAVFVSLGTVTIGYRLVADPGLDFALNGPLAEVIAVYGGALAGFVAGLVLIRGLVRTTARTVLDSAAWSTGGLLLSVLLFRWLDTLAEGQTGSHWAMGLFSVIWFGLMAAQLQRLNLGGYLRFVRAGLAAIFGLLGVGALTLALTFANPVLGASQGAVLGPPVANTLAVAYLLPALALALTAWRLRALDNRLRIAGAVVAGGVAVFWVFATIRHVWQGAEGMDLAAGMTQPELYSYTVALLLAGAALSYQALARRSPALRRVGLAVLVLAVAKVFLVDAAGLTGLTRVFSFLLLGLALAGLAWLGRLAERTVPPRPGPAEGEAG